jgi:ligand-binding sensor domain-containing protein/signal transduction histidine kinase
MKIYDGIIYDIIFTFKLYFQKLFFAVVFVIIGLQSLFSQPQNFELKQISEEHGLPGATVRAIFQDSKFILWFGIESVGLCRYDGVSFTLYSNNNKDSSSLGNNFVNSICEDKDENLWIGTDEGLFRFNRNSEKFTAYLIKNEQQQLGKQIYTTKISPGGEVWIGTNKGVNIYDRKNDRFIRLPQLENGKELNYQVNSICFDNDKNVWLGTSEGLLKLPNGNRDSRYWVNISKQSLMFSNTQIKDLCFDKQNMLWMITSFGCVKYDPNHRRFYELKELNHQAFTSLFVIPVAIMCDSKGLLWIGAEGLVVVDPKNNSFNIYKKNHDDPNGLKSNDIRAIYEDKSGLIWIGTKFEGLQIYNYRKELFPRWKNQIENNHKGLNDKNVDAICEDSNQKLYIGTSEGGLNVFDRKTGLFTFYTHDKKNPASISENHIYVMMADHNDDIWIGTPNYLERFDTRRKIFAHYPIKGIWSIYEDSKRNLWVGRRPGLFLFDKIKHTFNAFHDPSHVFPEKNDLEIYKLYEDKDGNLWIGTYRDGVFKYDMKTGKIIQFRNNPVDSTSLSNDRIRSIYEDSKGRLWIGTRLQGLNYFDRSTQTFTRYTMNNGLPSNSIYCILEDNAGHLWLATHNGISKFNPESKTFENYDKDYGLQDNVFIATAYCKSRSGELIFGGYNGFNMFFPDKIKKEVYFSPLIITSIKTFDQTIYRDLSNSVDIVLAHNKNYLSFSFALFDYYNPLKNKYQYKMENMDKAWITCGNRHYVSYSNLAPGVYKFSVMAENAYGVWNKKSLSVTIKIRPPWWKTWWFKSLVLIIFMLSIYLAYHLRLESYQLKQKELSILVKKRTQEISQANEILLERQTRIEEYAEELRTHTENLQGANDLLISKQKLIETQTQQLNDTNQQLAILNSTKDRFFAIIAHDLRNPFHTVSGFTELLINDYKKLPAEKIERFLKLIYASSTSGNNLLENLLQWSRSQTGRISYDPITLNISAVADETINFLEGDAIRKNIKICSSIDQEIMVFADENMIKTIFRNLISNAIKFTPENGSVTITSASDDSQVEITVADTGVGVPQEYITRLFRIDTPVSTRGTSNETGTGLGLILCKEFVEKHHGKIWVESEEGTGSMFKFTLPWV